MKKHVAKTFQGLPIIVEFEKGDKRPYRDDAGAERFTVMRCDYGYVKGTAGLDGEGVDVFLGPKESSDKVYVVKQMKRGDFKSYDEDKVVLGCSTAAEARALYLAHYSDPRFCGGIKELSMSEFEERLKTRRNAKLARDASRIAELGFALKSTGDNGVKIAKEESSHRLPPGLSGIAVGSGAALGAAAGHHVMDKRIDKAMERHFANAKGLQRRPAVRELARLSELKKTVAAGRGASLRKAFVGGALAGIGGASIYNAAQHYKEKKASEGHSRVMDHVDDLGIGLLAAPYVAGGVAKHLGGRAGALGSISTGAARLAEHMKNKHRYEIAGLSMVAPSLTHHYAKAVEKVAPEKRAELEKLAMQINKEYEDLPEEEKLAFLGAMASIANRGKALLGRGISAVKGVAAKAPGAAVAAAPATPGKLLSPRNIGKAALIGGAGLGMYGTYKGINAGAKLLEPHEKPEGPPAFQGPRLF